MGRNKNTGASRLVDTVLQRMALIIRNIDSSHPGDPMMFGSPAPKADLFDGRFAKRPKALRRRNTIKYHGHLIPRYLRLLPIGSTRLLVALARAYSSRCCIIHNARMT
jgi:hypothetical protein